MSGPNRFTRTARKRLHMLLALYNRKNMKRTLIIQMIDFEQIYLNKFKKKRYL